MGKEHSIILKLLRLCSTPKDTWDEDDWKSLNEAREHVKEHSKKAVEEPGDEEKEASES